MTKTKYLFFLLALSFFNSRSNAQEKSEFNISIADRTEETGLLDKGQWQIESGFMYTKFRESGSSEIGQLFLRHGVGKKFELRLLIEDGHGRDKFISETVQSTYPLTAGAKFKVLENHRFLPDMTLVGYLQIPFTAHTKTQTMYWSPLVFMAFQHKIGDKWSINYNAGVQQEAVGTTFSAITSGSVHYKIIEAIEVFTEYYAQYEPNENPQHNVGAGITWQANGHLAFYASSGTSLFNNEGNHFYSAGISARFPD